MRYVFIVNPKAGKKNSHDQIIEAIKRDLEPMGIDYTCYCTSYRGHATELAKMEADKGDEVRIIACGGDGTVNEVARALVGHPNAKLGIYPCGSGNDYIKTFDVSDKRFRSLCAQENGQVIPVDIIRADEMYGINICSLGVDAKATEAMLYFKKNSLDKRFSGI